MVTVRKSALAAAPMMRQARVGFMRCTDLATLIAWLKLPFTYSVWALLRV